MTVTKNGKQTLSLVLAVLMLFGLLSAAPVSLRAAANEYTEQFGFYADSAAAQGLAPVFAGSMDDTMTVSDLFDFIFQFAEVKCGLDTDVYLSRHGVTASAGDAAKAAALNDLLAGEAWNLSAEGGLSQTAKMASIVGTFQFAAHKLIAPFSPLYYYADNPITSTDRFNFQNNPYVVYHEANLTGLMSEIVGLSRGTESAALSAETTVTRRQFAAFCYMFSTMSLPLDREGRYGGGLSGVKDLDDFIAGILDEAVTPGLTDEQQIKAVYDYMIEHYRHNDQAIPWLLGDLRDGLNPLTDAAELSRPIVNGGVGTCDVFANVLRLLALRLGYECNYVSGQYVNRDGSAYGHGWNQIKVNDEWYWLDVDVEGSVFHRGTAAAPSYYLFMKKDAEWLTNHAWIQADWPAADGTKHPVELSAYGAPGQAAGSPAAAPASAPAAHTARSADVLLRVDGREALLYAYHINGSNYYLMSDIAYLLAGTESQFETDFDEDAQAFVLERNRRYSRSPDYGSDRKDGQPVPAPVSPKVSLDGREIPLSAYYLDGKYYFRLQDLGAALGFSVKWDGVSGRVVVTTRPAAAQAPVEAPITAADTFKAVYPGSSYTVALKADGGLWGFGANNRWQLGDGTATNRLTPVKIMDGVASAAVDGLRGIGMAVRTDGSLWGWGSNSNGQIGDGTTIDRPTPVKIMDGVASVSVSEAQTMAVKTDGSLWGWGRSTVLGESLLGIEPVRNETLVTDGTWTGIQTVPVKIMDGVASVSTSRGLTMAVKTDGSLWAFGSDDMYEVWRMYAGWARDWRNPGPQHSYMPVKLMDGVSAVSLGYNHVMIIKTDGSLWAFGDRENGQIGDGAPTFFQEPTGEGKYRIIDNTLTVQPVKIMDGVASVSAASDYTLAVKTDGSLWLWGHNGGGRIGHGADYVYPKSILGTSANDVTTPVKVLDNVVFAAGESHSMAITADGGLWGWGYQTYGMLGDGVDGYGKGEADEDYAAQGASIGIGVRFDSYVNVPKRIGR